MKLYLIPQDKANHFIYGFVIFILSNLIISNYLSILVVMGFAFGKEIYDEWKYSGFNIWDAVVTLIPSLILTLIQII
jgi:hypothetical protein